MDMIFSISSSEDDTVTSEVGNAGALAGKLTNASSVKNVIAYNSSASLEATVNAGGTGSAGGLIGSASGTVKSSYATGLVKSDTAASAHALIGSGSVEGTGNKYLWIINQDQDWQKDIVDHSADPAAAIPGGIQATDVTKNTDAYRGFLSGESKAVPYDTKGTPNLSKTYGGKYPMLSIEDLGGSVGTNDYVSAHYGDWPMPEPLVINP